MPIAAPRRDRPTHSPRGPRSASATRPACAGDEAFRTRLALIAEKLGDHTDEYAQALLGRAIAFEGSGRSEEAAALRRQRHAVLRALYGDEHPFVRSVAAAMASTE